MTVKELIEQLQVMPQDALVAYQVENYDQIRYEPVDYIELNRNKNIVEMN